MSLKSELPRRLERQGEMRALQRARRKAWDIAARTGTPIVIYQDGKIAKRAVALTDGYLRGEADAGRE